MNINIRSQKRPLVIALLTLFLAVSSILGGFGTLGVVSADEADDAQAWCARKYNKPANYEWNDRKSDYSWCVSGYWDGVNAYSKSCDEYYDTTATASQKKACAAGYDAGRGASDTELSPCQEEYPGDGGAGTDQHNCWLGYTYGGTTPCEEMPAVTNIDACNKGVELKNGEGQDYEDQYPGVNPGKNKETCEAYPGTWNLGPPVTCGINTSQGKCDEYGGSYSIMLGVCQIPKGGGTPGQGTNCGDFGCGESPAQKYCDKYKKDSVKKACRKGFYDGEEACKKLKGEEKKACEFGAKSAAAIPDGDEVGASPVGKDYDKVDCTNGLEGRCELVNMIVKITNAISALAAVVIVAMIIWGGIQYSMAGADAAKVQAAKSKIVNALVALLLLIFGFSIIQWLVPGGLI